MPILSILALAGALTVDGVACRAIVHAKAAFEDVRREDTVPVPCAPTAGVKGDAPLLRFDPVAHVVRAQVPLAAGQFLGHAFIPATPLVRRGNHMVLKQRVGPVSIEREVIAMQDGYAGGHVFVRDSDGAVFAIATTAGEARP